MINNNKRFIEYIENILDKIECIGNYIVAFAFIYLIIHLLKAFL
jgi:hypothetical protein